MNQLMRQATLGALTSSLLHDVSSMMQTLSVALADVTALAADGATPMLTEAIAEAGAAGEEAIQLFVQMRKFIRDGEVALRPVRADRLVSRAVRLAGGYVRERAQLRVGELPTSTFRSPSRYFSRCSSTSCATRRTPPRAMASSIARQAHRDRGDFTVVDDGPGVAPEIADYMFEPFASTTHGGTGLGLAISAYVVQLLGGRINYRRDADRGACFTVSLPRTPSDETPTGRLARAGTVGD